MKGNSRESVKVQSLLYFDTVLENEVCPFPWQVFLFPSLWVIPALIASYYMLPHDVCLVPDEWSDKFIVRNKNKKLFLMYLLTFFSIFMGTVFFSWNSGCHVILSLLSLQLPKKIYRLHTTLFFLHKHSHRLSSLFTSLYVCTSTCNFFCVTLQQSSTVLMNLLLVLILG